MSTQGCGFWRSNLGGLRINWVGSGELPRTGFLSSYVLTRQARLPELEAPDVSAVSLRVREGNHARGPDVIIPGDHSRVTLHPVNLSVQSLEVHIYLLQSQTKPLINLAYSFQ